MDIYKQAIMQDLMIQTSKGMLNLYQLKTLDINELDRLAVKLQDEYENSKGKSFITKRSTKDAKIKLQFDIVLDTLETKQAIQEEAAERKENKEFNEKILNIIADKQDDALKGKSIAELKKLLK